MTIVSPSDTRLVLELAHSLGATYYASAYIIAAYELEAVLVTDDEKPPEKNSSEKRRATRVLGREVELYPSSKLAEQPERQR